MVTRAIEITGLATAGAYILDALTPLSPNKGCSAKNGYAITQWASLAISIVAIASAILGAITGNTQLLIMSLVYAPFTLTASYCLKQLFYKNSIEADANKLDGIDKSLKKTAETYKEQIAKLEEDNADIQKDLDSEKESTAQLEKERDELATAQKAQDEKIEELEKQVEEFQKVPAQLQTDFTAISKDVADFTGSLTTLAGVDSDQQKAIANLKELSDSLTTHTATIHDEETELEEQLEHVAASIKLMQQIYTKTVNLLKAEQQSTAELTAEVNALNKAEQQVGVIEQGAAADVASSQATRKKADSVLGQLSEILGGKSK